MRLPNLGVIWFPNRDLMASRYISVRGVWSIFDYEMFITNHTGGSILNWLIASFIATVGFAGMSIIITKFTGMGLAPEVINFFLFSGTGLGFLAFILVRRTTLSIPVNAIPWFILLAAIAVAANYYSVVGFGLAPNPGYVRGVAGFEVAIVAVAAVFLFGSELTLTKSIGIGFSLVGLLFLSRG